MSKFILVLFLPVILLEYCSTLSSQKLSSSVPKINVTLGTVFTNSQLSRENSDQEIIRILQILVDSTLQKNFHHLPQLVSIEKGLYVDLKAHFTYAKLVEEVKAKDSYFEIFFFDSDKLKKEKNSVAVKTVREILLLSEGLQAEIYYESNGSAEVKLRFLKNQKWEGDLNTVIFFKKEGKWWLERLF